MAKNELAPPPGADTASEAVELLRAWVIDKALHVSLFPTAFDDATTWGILLADVTRHVANALHEAHGTDVDEVVQGIKFIYDAELTNPTDAAEGEFREREH